MTPAAILDLRQQVTALVSRVILESSGRTVVPQPEDALLHTGDLDSMSVTSLILALETEFGIQIDTQDLSEETLGSVAAITRLIADRRAA